MERHRTHTTRAAAAPASPRRAGALRGRGDSGRARSPSPCPSRWTLARATSGCQLGRAGLMKFLGHEHHIEAPLAEGRGSRWRRRSRALVGPAALRGRDASLVIPGSEPADDIPKVEERMRGPEVLEVARYPEIAFASTSVKSPPGGPPASGSCVAGTLTLRGRSFPVEVPLEVARVDGRHRGPWRAVPEPARPGHRAAVGRPASSTSRTASGSSSRSGRRPKPATPDGRAAPSGPPGPQVPVRGGALDDERHVLRRAAGAPASARARPRRSCRGRTRGRGSAPRSTGAGRRSLSRSAFVRANGRYEPTTPASAVGRARSRVRAGSSPVCVASGTAISGSRMPARSLPSASTAGTSAG